MQKKSFLLLIVLIGIWGLRGSCLDFYKGLGPSVYGPPQDIVEVIHKTEMPLKLPQGFSLSIFAQNLGKPRVMVLDPGGNLVVSLISKGTAESGENIMQDRIRDAEQRVTGIREEIITLSREAITKQELSTVFSLFGPTWELQPPREQSRLINLLLEKIGYDGKKESVALTFRPNEIKALAQEMNVREQGE